MHTLWQFPTLVFRIHLIEVRGKSTRGIRRVFILLTPDMVRGIEYILRTRAYAGVNPNSKYVFGRTSASPQDGCAAMRAVSKACPGLSNPDLMRTRLLRRYLATSSQVQVMFLSCHWSAGSPENIVFLVTFCDCPALVKRHMSFNIFLQTTPEYA